MKQLPNGLSVTDAKFLPIIAAYVNKLRIVETVNLMCPTEGCDVSPGHMVAAMIIDTLSGRHPLYRLESSFENLDIELLLGIPITWTLRENDPLVLKKTDPLDAQIVARELG